MPTSIGPEILDRIHEGNQGVTKCRERARRAVPCTELRANPKEPMIPGEVPDRPWQVVGNDIYLIVVDYFPKFIEVNYLASLTVVETLSSPKSVFAKRGILDILRSENGPQYDVAVFVKFAKDCESKYVTSSPLYRSMPNTTEKLSERFEQQRTC